MADDEHELINLASLARRVEAVSYIAERQRETISEIVNEAVALDMRVRSLEGLAQTAAITKAREDARDEALYERLSRIEDQIKDIRGVGSKALWIIAGGILAGIVAFMMAGGFKIH